MQTNLQNQTRKYKYKLKLNIVDFYFTAESVAIRRSVAIQNTLWSGCCSLEESEMLQSDNC